MNIIVHCQASGPTSVKPGQKIVAARFAPDDTTAVAKAANKAVFTNGVPGILVQLGNLTEAAAAQFEPGALYELHFKKVSETPAPAAE